MRKLLEVKNLHVSYYTYAGEVQAVRGIHFYLDEGETIAIVGESGSGKSVTAKSIMRLIKKPGKIKEGSQMVFDGNDLLAYDKKELSAYRGGKAAMIFQDALAALNPTMTVGKQIAENLVMHRNMSKKEALKEAARLLHMVGIPEPEKRINQFPHEFSGGMRQRVMIAIAFACTPKMLIADEPTTALDVTIQAQILALMNELTENYDTSVIVITHDLGVIAETCQRMAVLYAGQVVEQGEVAQVFSRPRHPYTKGLLRSVTSLGKEQKRLYSIKGMVPAMDELDRGCRFFDRCDEAQPICKSPQVLQEVSPGHLLRCVREKEGQL